MKAAPDPVRTIRFTRVRRCVAHAVLLAGPAFAAACTAPGDSPADDATGGRAVRIVVVTHGQSSDPFWSVVANGARAGATRMDARVEYQAPLRFDMVEMSELIDAARVSRPDGMVVSIPDADALRAAILAVTSAGIPVVSINSGDEASRALGALAHIGQPEYDAGRGAGERLAADGVTHALCVNHEVGNLALDRRCDGLRDALVAAGARAGVLAVDLADPDDAEQRVAGALAADPSVDGMLTLGPAAIDPALAALRASGRAAAVRFATFDLTPRATEALRAGDLAFAIDQQPWLQGWLGVVLLVNWLETRTLPGGGHVIATGPAIVTGEDVDAIEALVQRGIR